MLPALPGLRFRLFGFPVTIGLDFVLITVLIGLQARPGLYLLEWLAVVAVCILIHELGHAFAVRQYGITPEIRLWGMGGLTSFGFALPPRKSIVVSLAGPLIGVPLGLFAMVVRPWLPDQDPLRTILFDVQWISLIWGIVNLLPIAGLDGGNVVQQGFLAAMGERGRRPGLILVGVSSVIIAVVAAVMGFVYLTIVIVLFAVMSPDAYLVLWRMVSPDRGGRGAGAAAGGTWRGGLTSGQVAAAPAAAQRPPRSVAVAAADARRVFGEIYGDVMPGAVAGEIDLDELERSPAPLLADVAGMIARRDDPAVAARLASEHDPLAVLGIVTRVVEGKRVSQLLGTLRRDDGPGRVPGLLKLQVGLHALARFEDSIAAAAILGRSGGAGSAVLEARTAARLGDKKRCAEALERAVSLGAGPLSEEALGDLVRLGPDNRVGAALSKLRSSPTIR